MKSLFKSLASVSLVLFLAAIMISCGGKSDEKTKAQSNEMMHAQSDTASAPADKLNMNTATGDQFQKIPGVGDRMVHEFEEYRPYTSIRQFRKEIGKYVDEQQVAAYEKYIYVPINRNESDAQTLMQIPGLDDSAAQKLISGRPYQTNQAFYDALPSSVSEEQMAKAKQYMKSN